MPAPVAVARAPASAVPAAAPQTTARAEKDRDGLDLLFASAARTTASVPAKVVTARAKPVAAAETLPAAAAAAPATAFGFTRGRATDMATDKFTGRQ